MAEKISGNDSGEFSNPDRVGALDDDLLGLEGDNESDIPDDVPPPTRAQRALAARRRLEQLMEARRLKEQIADDLFDADI